MRNNNVANGETRTRSSLKPSMRCGTLNKKHTDFSVQIVSEAFRGMVRVFQTALRTSPVSMSGPAEHTPTPQDGECRACRRVQKRASRAVPDYQDARRISEGRLIGHPVSERDFHAVAVAFMSIYCYSTQRMEIRRRIITSVTQLRHHDHRELCRKENTSHSLRSFNTPAGTDFAIARGHVCANR